MGRRDRERIERIRAGKELPRSVTHPKKGKPPAKFIVIATSQVGREQRRDNSHINSVLERKDEIAKQRIERDKMKKLSAYGAMSPLP